MSEDKIKVIIVDDLATTRESVVKLLQFEPNVTLVAEARTGLEAIETVRSHRPDIVLMDINMPDMDGISASQRITGEFPNTQIIMMSVQSETDYIRRAMVAGARDFLTKPFSLDELLTAIHNAYKRKQEMPTQVVVADRRPAIDGAASFKLPSEQVDEGNVVTVYSPKGGVGCTTLAVNIAVSLARKGHSTVLVDGNLQFGDVNVVLNMKAKTTILDLVERGEELDAELITSVVTSHKSGLKILAAPLRPEMAEAIKVHHMESLISHLRQLYSFVVIDTGSRLDDMTLAMLDGADKVLLVVQPELTGITHASRFLDLAHELGYEREKTMLVVSGVLGKQGISPTDVSKALKRPSPFIVPDDGLMAREAINRGEPLVVGRASGRPIGKALDEISKQLVVAFEAPPDEESESKAKKPSFFARLFGRG
ncbi:MAG: response regulator [Candidatus Promineifilaceae bacterium]